MIQISKVSLAHFLLLIAAIISLGFLGFEMFPWGSPRVFHPPKLLGVDFQHNIIDIRLWSANQGLYNGFLALGLIWSIFSKDAKTKYDLARFFAFCMLVAGLFGAGTVSRSFLVFQATPAAIALVVVWFALKPI